MKAMIKFVGVLGVAALLSTSAFAVCPITQNFTFLQASIAGRCPGSAYCLIQGGSGVSNQGANFWALGFGDPATGVGNDNGGWPSNADVDPFKNWLRAYGPDTYVSGTWAQDNRTDGCIHNQIAAGKTKEIQVVMVSDGNGKFAAMAAGKGTPGPTVPADYDFDQMGGALTAPANVVLRNIPKPVILASTRVGNGADVTVKGVALADVSNAAYGDGSTTAGDLIKGYVVCRQQVGRGATAPTNRDRGAGWACGGTVNLGQDANLNITCATNQDSYLGIAMVGDSGFITKHVGANSLAVQCGPTLADPKFKMIDKKGPRKAGSK